MLGNWIKQTTTNTGTPFTLASVAGFDTFNSQFGNSGAPPFRYFNAIFQDGNNLQWAKCHMTSSTVLAIDEVNMTFSGGTMTHYGAALTLSGGSVNVFNDFTAETSDTIYVLNAASATGGVPYIHCPAYTTDTHVGAGYLCTYPFVPALAGLYTGVLWHLTALAAATKMILGIYETKPDGTPGNLIAKTATITGGSFATGDHQTTFSANVFLRAQNYLFAMICDDVPTYNCPQPYALIPGFSGGVQGTGQLSTMFYNNVGAFSVLPDPAPAMTQGSRNTPLFSLTRSV